MGRKRKYLDHKKNNEPVKKKPKLIYFSDDGDISSSDSENENLFNNNLSNDLNNNNSISSDDILPGWMKNGQVLENWKEIPVESLSVWLKEGIKERLIKSLPPAPKREKLTLFPVQAAVLPGIIRGVQQVQDLCPLYNNGDINEIPSSRKPIALGAGDVLVCAPTGSGKTLAYILPIIQALETRIIPQIRTIVLLPSRDLALQVFNVFESLIEKSNQNNTNTLPLRIVTCIGKSEFTEEVNNINNPHICDIIIATPGRLIDHLNDGLLLNHLQYLIIDEADRLLMQSYQDWAVRILTTARGNIEKQNNKNINEFKQYNPLFTLNPSIPSSAPLRKYLFSATLTRNPAKIANLQLYNPLYFHAAESGRFTIPESLKEYKIICNTIGEKPLILLQLLQDLNLTQTLCFTKSIEATHRLFILLKLMGITDIYEYSSNLSQHLRSRVLQQFRDNKIRVLICSDAMARGMDIEDIDSVINYDSPTYIKTYIHRAGRTARAGKDGKCFSILAEEELEDFNEMRNKAEDAEKVSLFTIDTEKLKDKTESYSKALSKLKITLQKELKSTKKRKYNKHKKK